MRLRSVLRIARWETTRGVSGIDRRTAAVFVVVLVLLGVLLPVVAAGGAGGNQGIYRVAVEPESRYAPVVQGATSLRPVPIETTLGTGADLRIRDGVVTPAPTQTGEAALAALRRAVAAYNDQLMRQEPDRAAAFPVRVTLRYADQTLAFSEPDETNPTDGSDGTGPGTGPDDTTDQPRSGDDGGDGLGETLQSLSQALLGGTQTGTPGAIAPPVPVRSLVLAFLFVVPLNVIIQAFGTSVMTERLDRRGEPLLVTPISRYAVVAGKTLPYLVASLLITGVVAFGVGGSVISVLAVMPLALLFLSASFLAAMFARSYRELSFLTVAVSVSLTAYAFVPAIFTEIAPIAAMSPLSIVVFDLAGDPVTWPTFLFATVPSTVVACILFALGVGVFREEDMFGHHPVPAKILDAFAAQLKGRFRIALWSALLVPFAFLGELLAVALLVAVQAPVTIPVLLAFVAVIEEGAKLIHIRAGFQRGRLTDSDRGAVLAGVQSGLGFAVAEKLVLAVQLVGLSELALAQAAFAPIGVNNPVALGVLLTLPFVMHIVTAVIGAVGARRSRAWFMVTYGSAVFLHFFYDLAVVITLG